MSKKFKEYKDNHLFKHYEISLSNFTNKIDRYWKKLNEQFPLEDGWEYYFSRANTIQIQHKDCCSDCGRIYYNCVCTHDS
jgi:hypothetical protein